MKLRSEREWPECTVEDDNKNEYSCMEGKRCGIPQRSYNIKRNVLSPRNLTVN